MHVNSKHDVVLGRKRHACKVGQHQMYWSTTGDRERGQFVPTLTVIVQPQSFGLLVHQHGRSLLYCSTQRCCTRSLTKTFLWSPYVSRPLYFCPVISIYFLSFFSSPNLSGRRLDVYHTSTHGVALVRIQNAGLKPAARGSLKYRTQKSRQKSPSGHHRTTSSGYIFANKACIDNRKKLVKQQYLLHMSS